MTSKKPRPGPRATTGHTLLEVMIAVSLVTGIVLVGTSASSAISDASNYGRHRLQVQAENQSALYFIANDLQNSSSDTDPVTNAPRFQVLDDELVVEMKTRTAESLATGDTTDVKLGVTEEEAEETTETTETTSTSVEGVTTIGGANLRNSSGEILESRPRLIRVKTNSRFMFRKVTGYNVNLTIGEVSPVWSNQITYFVKKRRLIREEDGKRRVIGRNVSAFKVHAEAKGNFQVFLRTQKRDPSSGEVVTISGTIEVNPKNR